MYEAQTLLDIEKFMSSVSRRNYHWKDFESEYDQWLDDARKVYDEDLEYSPLIQAYFDLLPERIDWYDRAVFDEQRVFRGFQDSLRIRQQRFLNDFVAQVEDNLDQLSTYFDGLVNKHCKLLLVRVDLYYLFERSPAIRQFDRDVKKLINRVQNKDTIFQDQVGYAYRLEQGGKSKGYHCHLLVIYNGSIRCKDEYLGQCIGELWKTKITQGDGLFFNCNQKLHKQRYEDDGVLGIGMILRSVKKSVDNAFTVIGYLASPDKDKQYLRVRLGSRMRQFQIGQFKEK